MTINANTKKFPRLFPGTFLMELKPSFRLGQPKSFSTSALAMSAPEATPLIEYSFHNVFLSVLAALDAQLKASGALSHFWPVYC